MYLHLVFATRYRNCRIVPVWRDDYYAYIGGIIRNLHGESITIGGTYDHIHILCTLPKNMDVAIYLRHIKANSSKWIRTKHDK